MICQSLLRSEQFTLTVDEIGENDWVKLNSSSYGFYRVQYSNDMLTNLMPAVADMSLPPLDRLGLLDDLFALVTIYLFVFFLKFYLGNTEGLINLFMLLVKILPFVSFLSKLLCIVFKVFILS